MKTEKKGKNIKQIGRNAISSSSSLTLTAVCRSTFACRSLPHDVTCNEAGTYTFEMQCCISFKQWENRDVLGPSGISLMPNWISHVASQQLQFVSLLLGKCGTSRKGVFRRSSTKLIAISRFTNQRLTYLIYRVLQTGTD